MTFVVGVDGGGTRTRAVVVDVDGTEMGRAAFSGAVATAHAPERAAEAVAWAAHAAAEAAGVELPAASIWAGLAGAGADVARRAVARSLTRLKLAKLVRVGTDVEAAFHDAFSQDPGVLLIAGTGSIVWVRDVHGRTRQVGGWGEHLGDEGSGFAIGLAALRHLTRAHDGRAPRTELTEPLLDACGVHEVTGLVAWIGVASKAQVAALAPLVIEMADHGDRAAVEIVDRAVAELVTHVEVALNGESVSRSTPVVLWGGLLAEGGPLRTRVVAVLERSGVETVSRSLDPPMGAAGLALSELSEAG